ncbi:methyltransferase FkbM-like protein [Bradyrhizobium macuxiense]|uniref:Methyltransferase FkbM-like protein n=1 Tax=Bradyrhizobium macuxiense TaxID=1755647 RepID=A0A560KVT1_9BRAD|nr:FkbM family methyltransferase [Bradyrhizobium macuxiense]TWB87312.1 methyltransferase FkbM-like protein [Bradyrhizobium macuxiense]
MVELEIRRRAIEVLSLLRPVSVIGHEKARRGDSGDGGYVVLDDFRPEQPVYSLGVGQSCSFDLAFAERGHIVYMYDGTVEGPTKCHPNFRFHKRMIDTGEGSLANIITKNGHSDRDDLFMQMDVEHDEYEVIPATPPNVLDQFKQIVIEIHWLPHLVLYDVFEKMLATLKSLRRSHDVIHVHANNYGKTEEIEGVHVIATAEVTLVRRKDYLTVPCLQSFPTRLDTPNNPREPDVKMGRIGIKPADKWCVHYAPLIF